MERDHRPDAGGDERVDHVVVVRERGLVDLVALRFDARPLDAEAIAVEVELRDELDVVERRG